MLFPTISEAFSSRNNEFSNCYPSPKRQTSPTQVDLMHFFLFPVGILFKEETILMTQSQLSWKEPGVPINPEFHLHQRLAQLKLANLGAGTIGLA